MLHATPSVVHTLRMYAFLMVQPTFQVAPLLSEMVAVATHHRLMKIFKTSGLTGHHRTSGRSICSRCRMTCLFFRQSATSIELSHGSEFNSRSGESPYPVECELINHDLTGM